MNLADTHAELGRRHSPRNALVVIVLVSLIAAFLPKFLAMSDEYNQVRLRLGIDFLLLSHPLLRVLIVCMGVSILRRILRQQDPFTLGVKMPWHRVAAGLAIGLGCSIPMLAIGLIGGMKETDYRYMYAGTLIAAFNEEFVFRAFTFGLMVQAARIRVWPAAIFSGFLFGVLHISFVRASEEGIFDQINLFLLMTTLGGVLYAWLYHRSRYNLWVVMSLHFFMNLWWTILDVNGTQLGPWGTTLSRVACVTVAVFLLIYMYPKQATIEHDGTT